MDEINIMYIEDAVFCIQKMLMIEPWKVLQLTLEQCKGGGPVRGVGPLQWKICLTYRRSSISSVSPYLHLVQRCCIDHWKNSARKYTSAVQTHAVKRWLYSEVAEAEKECSKGEGNDPGQKGKLRCRKTSTHFFLKYYSYLYFDCHEIILITFKNIDHFEFYSNDLY